VLQEGEAVFILSKQGVLFSFTFGIIADDLFVLVFSCIVEEHLLASVGKTSVVIAFPMCFPRLGPLGDVVTLVAGFIRVISLCFLPLLS